MQRVFAILPNTGGGEPSFVGLLRLYVLHLHLPSAFTRIPILMSSITF
jgi:hypothetical protein